MVWSKVVCPEADSAMSTATVSGRESMLICVPSGAMSWFDWLSSYLDESVLVFVVCADLLWGLLDGLSDFLFGSFWL